MAPIVEALDGRIRPVITSPAAVDFANLIDQATQRRLRNKSVAPWRGPPVPAWLTLSGFGRAYPSATLAQRIPLTTRSPHPDPSQPHTPADMTKGVLG